MRILVTGASGSLGRRLVEELLAQGSLLDRTGKARPVTLLAGSDLKASGNAPADPRYRFVPADLSRRDEVAGLLSEEFDSIFHLATVTSGMAQADFDLGMRVNVDATRHLLDLCKERGGTPRFVYSSSGAVFGKTMAPADHAEPPVAPENSYGAQKAICELLVDDYTRRGFVSGCSLRLPTILVRPDRSETQTTDFASHIVREAVAGHNVTCAIPLSTSLVVKSPRATARGLMRAHDLRDRPGGSGASTMPALRADLSHLLEALARVAGQATADRIAVAEPGTASRELAKSGWDELDDIIREYLADRLDAAR